MKSNRREFLKQFLATTAFGSIQSTAWAQESIQAKASPIQSNYILGGASYRNTLDSSTVFSLAQVDLSTGSVNLGEMSFLAHGIHKKPNNPYQLAIFEKKGPNACEYDLKTNKIIRTITPHNSRHFYGHGAYSADSSVLFSTETDLKSGKGYIGIRDSQDMSFLGEFPSFGSHPHECKLIDSGNTLVITNAGGSQSSKDTPSVCYVDMNSLKLMEKITLTEQQINTGHFALHPDGSLVVASAPRSDLDQSEPGGVSIKPKNKQIISLTATPDTNTPFTGEALSIAIDSKSNTAAITHPSANLVSFWNTLDGQYIKSIEFDYPRGITLTSDGLYFLLSYSTQTKLQRVEIANLTTVNSPAINNSYISGSHLYNWHLADDEIHYHHAPTS